jgi:hypothetical protein
MTALHIVASLPFEESVYIVHVFFENGANPNIKDLVMLLKTKNEIAWKNTTPFCMWWRKHERHQISIKNLKG